MDGWMDGLLNRSSVDWIGGWVRRLLGLGGGGVPGVGVAYILSRHVLILFESRLPS
jgi:hypothetical protein